MMEKRHGRLLSAVNLHPVEVPIPAWEIPSHTAHRVCGAAPVQGVRIAVQRLLRMEPLQQLACKQYLTVFPFPAIPKVTFPDGAFITA